MGGALIIDPNDESVYWCGGVHDYSAVPESTWQMGVSKTTDGGTTWTHYTLDIADSTYPYGAYTHAIAIDPSNSSILYAGGIVEENAALYKTTDGGDTWSDITSGVSGCVRALAVNSDNANIIYAGSDDGVFKSTDAGVSWTNMGLDTVQAIVVDPDVPNIISVGTKTGVYVSFNAGGEWGGMNEGLDPLDVLCLGLHPDNYLFAGTWGKSMYRCVPEYDDVWPPAAPYIMQAEKSGNDVKLTWNAVTTDTLNNPETMDYYVVYRDTTPDFIIGSSDSIAAVVHPGTEYTDAGALTAGENYYYLVKAFDAVGQRSKKSNMVYLFNKFVNENAAVTDKNWVSLPWHSGYSTASDVANDLSSSGDPLTKITNLRDEQLYESWSFTTVPFPRWTGTNFAIESGRGYEFVTKEGVTDTTWNPTEYSNEIGPPLLAGGGVHAVDIKMHVGTLTEPDRAPVWSMADGNSVLPHLGAQRRVDRLNAHEYSAVRKNLEKKADFREVGISHLVRGYFELRDCEDIAFTV